VKRWWWLGASALLIFGCARPQLPDTDLAVPDRQPPVAATDASATGAEQPAEPAPPPEPVTPALTIEAPATGEVFQPAQPVEVRVAFSDGAGQGALILIDNGASRLLEPGKTSLVVGALPPGPHVIRAVALADDAMSLDPGAMAVSICQVGEGEATPSGFDPAGPIVTLGKPTREAAPAETGEIAFELRIDNATLSEGGTTLKWRVDEGEVEWLAEYPPSEPLSLGRLEPGKHRLVAWLESADGVPLNNGGYERVALDFTVPAAGGAG